MINNRNDSLPQEPQKYSFQFNGDVDSCAALADLLRAGWGLANVHSLEVREGFAWINLQRYGRRAV